MELIRDQLVEYIGTIARPGIDLTTLANNANLFDEGVIDSFALIQIIFYLEQEHGIDLQSAGIDPTDLTSIDGILAAIKEA
jgi:acyl carrier protein